MKKMYSEEQLAEIAGEGFDPADIEAGDIDQDAILGLNSDNELVKGNLYGKFVRIMKATELNVNAITDEQWSILKNGVFIDGTILGFRNPIIFPFQPHVIGTTLFFSVMMTNSAMQAIACNLETHKLEITNNSYGFDFASNVTLFARWLKCNQLVLDGKYTPSYPADQTDKTYVLKLVNGTLTWVEETA